jgi:hypothetical protein
MIITMNTAGQQRIVDTDEYGGATTTGALFSDSEFREDFSVPDRAVPQVNGQAVESNTPLTENSSLSYVVPASSKS